MLYKQEEIDPTIRVWLICEISLAYLTMVTYFGVNTYVYCVIHSPKFQYRYYLSLRNYDNEEDEEYKKRYYS